MTVWGLLPPCRCLIALLPPRDAWRDAAGHWQATGCGLVGRPLPPLLPLRRRLLACLRMLFASVTANVGKDSILRRLVAVGLKWGGQRGLGVCGEYCKINPSRRM